MRKFSDWEIGGANIISLEEYSAAIKDFGDNLRIVCTSGGFDPIHPGHISCIQQSSQYGDLVAVIVNGDSFLRRKKGKPFQDLKTRCQIVSALWGVNIVIPFEIENDDTVSKALEIIKPHVFTKGGDRKDPTSIPEWDTCQRNNIEVIFGVGENKLWSSSNFLNDWGEFYLEQHR